MTSSAQQLIDMARLTPSATPFDWDHAGHRLHAPVPHDYRTLLDGGGGGLWVDLLRLYVPAPGQGLQHLDLERSGLEFDQLQDLFDDEAVGRPDDLDPDSRLLPWASTGAGVTLYWQVSPGAASDSYPIQVSDRNGDLWERYDRLTTDLLLGIVQGEVHSELIKGSWMESDVVFKSYADE